MSSAQPVCGCCGRLLLWGGSCTVHAAAACLLKLCRTGVCAAAAGCALQLLDARGIEVAQCAKVMGGIASERRVEADGAKEVSGHLRRPRRVRQQQRRIEQRRSGSRRAARRHGRQKVTSRAAVGSR